MHRYFMHIAFNGRNYFGWQKQPNFPTIQETLEHALSTLLKEPIIVIGAGRTDTGVHAQNFYAHFDTEKNFSVEDCKRLSLKLNVFLPQDIVIFNIFEVENQTHARFSAQSRTYRYFISTKKNPFRQETTYTILKPLQIDLMNECCQKLLIYNDFTSFSKLHTQTNNNNCVIYSAKWMQQENNILCFEITANRFLRNMVRAIVGTLLEVGKEKINVEDFCKIIEEKNRCKAGMSVPAHALFLVDIAYPDLLKK